MSLGGGDEGEASQPFLYIFFFFLRNPFFSSLNPVCCKAVRQSGSQAGSDCRPCLPAPSAQQRAKGPEAAGKRCAPSELGVSVGCDSLPVLQVKAAATVSNCQPLSSTALAFFFLSVFNFSEPLPATSSPCFRPRTPTPTPTTTALPLSVCNVAWHGETETLLTISPLDSSLSLPTFGHEQSEIPEMAVVAGDRRTESFGAILRCKAALRRPTTAHPRAHQSVKIFLAASHTVARRLDHGDAAWERGCSSRTIQSRTDRPDGI